MNQLFTDNWTFGLYSPDAGTEELLAGSAIAYALGFDVLLIEDIILADQIATVLTGLFIFVLVFGIIFVSRLRKINGKRALVPSLIYSVVCLAIIFFIDFLLELFNLVDFINLFIIIAATFVFTLVISVVSAIPLGALVMIFVNFANLGRPYVFFDKEKMPDFGDEEEETIVSQSFGEKPVKEEIEEKPKEKGKKKAEPAKPQNKKEPNKKANKPVSNKKDPREWVCPNCGKKNIGLFCSRCNQRKPK